MQNASHRFKPNEGKQKGVILYLVAASLVVLIGFIGLAIDLGHAYNNKGHLHLLSQTESLIFTKRQPMDVLMIPANFSPKFGAEISLLSLPDGIAK